MTGDRGLRLTTLTQFHHYLQKEPEQFNQEDQRVIQTETVSSSGRCTQCQRPKDSIQISQSVAKSVLRYQEDLKNESTTGSRAKRDGLLR